MDDIRRPQHLKRRDYAIPSAQPAPPPVQPRHPDHQPAPYSHLPAPAHPQPFHRPAPVAPQSPSQHPAPHHQPVHHPAGRPVARPKKPRLSGKTLSIMAGILLAMAAVFGAGYLLKGSTDSKGIPASITRQVNYDLYFPSPMPSGYIYMKNTATFQIGQVYYKFANGRKRVTVIEQPLTDPKPNLNLMQGYEQFDTAIGKAAIGVNLGETQAVIVTPTTVITMNSVGGVTHDDMRSAIDNLKNIGQRSQKT